VEADLDGPAHGVYPVGLERNERDVGGQQSLPFALAAETIEEQSDGLAGERGVRHAIVELMSAGVFHSLPLHHCGCDGMRRHILSGDGVLGLAHLDHAEQVGLAAWAPDILDDLLADEPAVDEEVVVGQVLYRSPAEHHLHVGYLVVEVFLLAFLHLGLLVALLAVACIQVLLGKALRPGCDAPLLALEGAVDDGLGAPVGTAEEESLVAEDAAAAVHMGIHPSEHLPLASRLRHVGVVDNHADGRVGVPGITADGDGLQEPPVDVPQEMSPVYPVVGEDAIEHVLVAVEEGLQGAAAVVGGVPDGEEREEDHQLDDLGTRELAVRSLLESQLPFGDVQAPEDVQYPLYAKAAAFFREKLAQFRNNFSIFVHARVYVCFDITNILKISEMTKLFTDFRPSFFCYSLLAKLK
jgi:hypothetical protein